MTILDNLKNIYRWMQNLRDEPSENSTPNPIQTPIQLQQPQQLQVNTAQQPTFVQRASSFLKPAIDFVVDKPFFQSIGKDIKE
jgi:hypothetical protein